MAGDGGWVEERVWVEEGDWGKGGDWGEERDWIRDGGGDFLVGEVERSWRVWVVTSGRVAVVTSW